MIYYLNRCPKPLPEAIEFISQVIPITSRYTELIITHHYLTINALDIIMSRISNKERYNTIGYLPTAINCRKPYIEHIAKAVGINKLDNILQFLHPELSKVNLSDVTPTCINHFNHCLDEESLLYYLHNDNDYSRICQIFNNTNYTQHLEQIIPKLTSDTPNIKHIIVRLVSYGFDVREVAKTIPINRNECIRLNAVFILVYLYGRDCLDKLDIDVFSNASYHLTHPYSATHPQEYKDICDNIRDHIDSFTIFRID